MSLKCLISPYFLPCVPFLYSPALMNVFLLEVHPSLCLVSAVYHGLVRAHNELCELHRATGVTDKLILRQKLLQLALQSWNSLASPGDSYSSQIQKDVCLFFLMHTYELIYLKKKLNSGFFFSILSCSQMFSLMTRFWSRRWACH